MNMPAPRHTLDDWFAASVAVHGDRTALETGGTELTYSELSLLASHLADVLVSDGGGKPPRRVGLLAGRTVVAYAGYLAIQRIGAAVVPLGPAFPAERNAGIARQASLDAVLSDGTAEPSGQLGVLTTQMTGSELLRRLGSPAPEPSAAGAGPDDLAYIMFTSGSTGVPKGVPVRQRNICAYLAHAVPHCSAGPGDRFSQTFELTFDPSVFDMYTAWGSGAAWSCRPAPTFWRRSASSTGTPSHTGTQCRRSSRSRSGCARSVPEVCRRCGPARSAGSH